MWEVMDGSAVPDAYGEGKMRCIDEASEYTLCGSLFVV